MANFNRKKFEKLQWLTLNNAIRLHFDSITLLKTNSYQSALLLSILSLEEIGKVYLIDDLVYYAEIAIISTQELEKLFSSIYTHKHKQTKAVRDFSNYNTLYATLFKEAKSGKLDYLKQKYTYVGLTKRSLKGKIESPFFTKKDSFYARRQVELVNTILLDMITNESIDSTFWISEMTHVLLIDPKLRSKIKRIEHTYQAFAYSKRYPIKKLLYKILSSKETRLCKRVTFIPEEKK